MSTLEEMRELLPTMSPGEKAQILQWLLVDMTGASAGIENTSGVMGGGALHCAHAHTCVAVDSRPQTWHERG
jgi:hypothetical protein